MHPHPLENKKILYIGVSTFNYEKEIKAGLESMGALVDYYDERPANDIWTKLFLRLSLKKLIQSKIDTHYSNILTESKVIDYEYVLIIKLETIDKKIIESLKKTHPNAIFILYLWDSIKNYEGKEKLISYFDKAYSFDKTDCKTHKNLEFLPLFYIKAYEEISIKEKNKYDLCFIGTGHSDRYQLVKKIEKETVKYNLNLYSFFFLQSKLIYWFRRIFDKKFQSARISDFSFSSLNQKQVIEKVKASNVIIDIEHQGQEGLTMRTIETLGAAKKLITTNKNIKEYDFYNETNILIIDRTNPILKQSFFSNPYLMPDKKIYKKYSLNNWLESLFLNQNL